MSSIELRGVCKSFGAVRVLSDVELTVASGSITAVLGASGSGKTTMLRLIAGFEQLDSGTIAIAGRLLDDGRRSVRPQQRGVGYVPQDGALFPHLTVARNVGFGLARGGRSEKTRELLGIVGLEGLEHRYPHELSGGQQQRVALARALAIEPNVVLLDEPFSSLDASLRVELGRDVVAHPARAGHDGSARHPRPERGSGACRPYRGAARRARACARRLPARFTAIRPTCSPPARSGRPTSSRPRLAESGLAVRLARWRCARMGTASSRGPRACCCAPSS